MATEGGGIKQEVTEAKKPFVSRLSKRGAKWVLVVATEGGFQVREVVAKKRDRRVGCQTKVVVASSFFFWPRHVFLEKMGYAKTHQRVCVYDDDVFSRSASVSFRIRRGSRPLLTTCMGSYRV